MGRKQKRKNRIFISVIFVLLASLLLGVLVYDGYIKDEQGARLFMGWAGIGIIVLLDILCFAGLSRQPQKRYAEYKKHSGDNREEKKSRPAPNKSKKPDSATVSPTYNTTDTRKKQPEKLQYGKSKPKQTHSKKKAPLKEIDLNIRPIDEDDFKVTQNIIATASSIILGTRKEQQDALYVTGTTFYGENENADVFGIVCDGMGGLANGGEASKTAVRVVSALYAKARPLANVGGFFKDAISSAQRQVQALSDAAADGKKAGTTLVSAIIQNDRLYTAAVGDSRIYIVRNNQIKMLTRDHNYYLLLKEQVKNGEITEQQMNMSSQKEALISYLGMPELKLMDIMSDPLKLINGDIVLLCSDGLTKALTKEEICNIITDNADKLQNCADMLTAAAQRKVPRGLDNTSVILLKYN